MDLKALELPGAYLLNPKRFRDARGFFVESYNKKTLAAHGLNFDFVQDNVSLSARTGTVRGLHFQSPPSEQTKLCWCCAARRWTCWLTSGLDRQHTAAMWRSS